jgi:polygalacturonase
VLAYNMTANGTTNCINFKSAITRGGTVENIYAHDITMSNVGTMLRATMNWNPSYSYSTLPQGYSLDSIPSHWKVMLQKVTPEQGTPHFRNVMLWNFTGAVRGQAVSIAGMKESPIENFTLSNINVEARSPGDITFASGWKFSGVSVKCPEDATLRVQNSDNMDVQINGGK